MPLFDDRRKIRPRPAPPEYLPELGTGSPVPLTPPMTPPSLGTPGFFGRQSRYDEMGEARDAYLQKTPGRFTSGALGALRGFAGGGLAGAITGGAYGAIDPRGLREQEFNQRIRPQIEDRFRFEDMDAARQAQEASAMQQGQINQARLGQMAAETAETQARTRKLGQPETPKAPTPAWKLGRNLRTGQFKWFNAADDAQAAEHEAHVAQPSETPIFRVDDKGNYVDVRKAAKEGKSVKAFQRPRAAAAPKKEQKFVSITQVRKAAEENGISESEAATAFKSKGYQIVR